MSKKRLKKATDEGFIPGIYNYCDRWCERCTLQLRCMSYVMGKKLEEKGSFHLDRENNREEGNIWTRLKEVFDSTYEVLHELAEERGISVEDIYASEKIDREFWGDDYENSSREQCYARIEASDLIRICCIYEHLADKCLEKIYESEDDQHKGEILEEALEIVNWYLDLIQAKIRRALYGYHLSVPGKNKDDYNGSAKVALLSIDRSIKNWEIIRSHYPEHQRDISHLLIILHLLQNDTDQQFPTARTFQRPGFDIPQ